MIDVRIVCAHEALRTAQTLQRLLGAEEHRVELCFGRASLQAIPASRTAREAVILIWSPDAQSASYMHDWAAQIDAKRVVEISRAPGLLRGEARKASMIDFTAWSGERGGNAWHALVDRLRAVARACEPPAPPSMRAAVALGTASAMAMAGALAVRVNDALNDFNPPEPTPQIALAPAEVIGLGGPVTASEPASFDEDDWYVETRRFRASLLDNSDIEALVDLPQPIEHQEFRRANVLDRLAGLARLPWGDDDEPTGQN